MLMPVSALPGAYGIGCFSKEAYEFVDILKEAGQKLWQILPLGQTGYGDSPYQSFSTFAGNPYFIDLETLIEDELLTKEECDQADFGENEEEIDYEKIYNARFKVLKLAYKRAKKNGLMESKAYRTYLEEENHPDQYHFLPNRKLHYYISLDQLLYSFDYCSRFFRS